jgi:hypothetical protein
VEDYLFSVPRSIFDREETSIFKDMFALPQRGSVDGLDDGHPLILPNLSPDDFRVFVKVSLARCVCSLSSIEATHRSYLAGCSTTGLLPILNLSEWKIILRLVDMWQMNDFRAAAIENMEPLFDDSTSVDQILLAKRYDITDWLHRAVIRIVMRQDPLSRAEMERLGFQTAADIIQVRNYDLRERLSESRESPLRVTLFQIDLMFEDDEDVIVKVG